MIYHIIIPENVYEELNEAALYYESKQKNLGVKFILEWEAAMLRLKRSPQLYQKKHKQLRGIKTGRFPYLMIFEIESDKIYLYRLIHSKKNPKKIFKK